MAGRLRRDHDHVEVGARHDLVVVDGETVGEGQGGTFLDVRLDFVVVESGLELVRRQDHDQVSSRNSFGNVCHLEAVSFALAAEAEPLRRPTVTSTPESLRLQAWAWPWEP